MAASTPETRHAAVVQLFEFDARNVCTPLSGRAARLYPDSKYLQAEWLRAVSVVRATRDGWQLERRVAKVQR